MPVAPGAAAPDFELPEGGGGRRSLAELAATGPVLLAFFKASCPTCQLAFPVYAELARRYGDAAPVVAVAQDPPAVARPWLDERGFAGPRLDDSAGYRASDAYGVRSVPTLVLVEPDATVARVTVARVEEGWDRDRTNALARELGERTGRRTDPVSTEGDGRPAFKPG